MFLPLYFYTVSLKEEDGSWEMLSANIRQLDRVFGRFDDHGSVEEGRVVRGDES